MGDVVKGKKGREAKKNSNKKIQKIEIKKMEAGFPFFRSNVYFPLFWGANHNFFKIIYSFCRKWMWTTKEMDQKVPLNLVK